MANEKARAEVTKGILEALDNGLVPWNQPWQNMFPMNVSGRPYRGVNRFMLSLVGGEYVSKPDEKDEFVPFKDNRYITFNKCKEMGGSVMKGKHGFLVIFWTQYQTEDENGKPKTIPYAKPWKIFNVEQCQGLDLPPIKGLDFKPIDKAQEIVDNWLDKPEIIHGGNGAGYSVTADKIYMPNRETFDSEEAYYATLFHELGHSTRHEKRLNRIREGDTSLEKYSKEELVAEMISAFLCAEAHITSSSQIQQSAAYIAGWKKRIQEDDGLVMSAASKAQYAVDLILGINVKAVPEGEPEAELVAA
jgi:antirestriction protein ArdC